MRRITVDGEIDANNGPIHCPRCSRTRGLTVYGNTAARIACPCGNDFRPGSAVDAVHVMQHVMAAAAR